MKIIEQGDPTLVRGIRASGVHCGIKTSGKKDLALIYSQSPATAAGVFTKNFVPAAPVIVTRAHLKDHKAQAIVINSGIANAATGEQGIADAQRMAFLTAGALNIPQDAVIVASTGMIGKFLPMEKISSGIVNASSLLSEEGGGDAAEAILTTDTFPKKIAVQIEISGSPITLSGIAKGAGMIKPDMATMLAFIFTDLSMDGPLLQQALRKAVERTFNSITVDSDTSTNDMVVVMANGYSGVKIEDKGSAMAVFMDALEYVCRRLAIMVVEDGEGSTKLVSIDVSGALDDSAAKDIALRIADSPLVKTSFYGMKCNWGRIMAAAGNAQIAIDPGKIDIYYGQIQVVKSGIGLGVEKEIEAEQYLRSKQIRIGVDLNMGKGSSTVWTTDLSPEYVLINADYMT